MDANILTIIQSRPDYKLSLEDIAVANAYVKANKTADLLALGEANSANTKTYHDCRQRLTDHSDYFGAVWNLFNRLPRGGLVDGWAKWSHWQESNFKAYEKNQRDYITKIAKAAVLRLRGEEPEKKEKKNYKTLALDLARMVLDGDRDSAEKLAQKITQDEKRKVSASEPADDVKTTPAPLVFKPAKKPAIKFVANDGSGDHRSKWMIAEDTTLDQSYEDMITAFCDANIDDGEIEKLANFYITNGAWTTAGEYEEYVETLDYCTVTEQIMGRAYHPVNKKNGESVEDDKWLAVDYYVSGCVINEVRHRIQVVLDAMEAAKPTAAAAASMDQRCAKIERLAGELRRDAKHCKNCGGEIGNKTHGYVDLCFGCDQPEDVELYRGQQVTEAKSRYDLQIVGGQAAKTLERLDTGRMHS